MNRFPVFSAIILFLTYSCNRSSEQEAILGAWSIQSVTDSGQQVSDIAELPADTAILFNEEGTFKCDSSFYNVITGKWAVVEDENVLYLFGDKEYDDSKWKIEMEKKSMIWTGVEPPDNKSLKIVYKKIKSRK